MAPEFDPTAEASAKDAVPTIEQASGSSRGPGTDVAKADVSASLRWKKHLDAIVQYDDMQEQASSGFSYAMSKFVERTTLVKKVCTPCALKGHGGLSAKISHGALRVTT
jgi:hypothetical protein